jgi:hypothetical protein
MDLKDPYPAYDADSNIEAMLVQRFLEERGIDAYAFEDGALMGHLGYGIHAERPQVWVSRDDEQRVADLLAEYEQHKAERAARRQALESQTIDAICEACGQTSTFEGSLNGTTQHCTHCGGYVDVGEFDWPYDEDFGTAEAGEV